MRLLAQVLEMTHFEAMTIFALVTSLVFTYLTKYGLRDRLKYFLWTFFLFMAIAIGLGWLMYPFPR